MASSLIKTHTHDNYDILKEFSEANSILLYKGKPISTSGGSGGDISEHEEKTVTAEEGIHGLRYYNSKLQYYNGIWNDVTTMVANKDITLSPAANNALVKHSGGYFVQGFLISQQSNNALVKYSDGYYVPKIPANNATTDDVDALENEINDKLTQQSQTFNERYNLIVERLQEVAGNSTKQDVHEFNGTVIDLTSIIDISSLYNLSSNVILNLEFMIKNSSDLDMLNIKILENGIETLNDTLTKSEVQRYKLPNIPNIEIFIKGSYELFLYVNYI